MDWSERYLNQLKIEDGLLLTEMLLHYDEMSIKLKRVLVDTGSGGTIVSADLVEAIGIVGGADDTIYRISGVGRYEFVYSKKIDAIRIGNLQVNDFPIEIGAMDYGFALDGIVGLNFLQKVGATINLENLTISGTKPRPFY
jgi:hypothetical protein